MPLALGQRRDAVVLLAEVREVEERRERARQKLALLEAEPVDEGDGVIEAPRRHRLRCGVHVSEQLVELVEQRGVVLPQDHAQYAQAEVHVGFQAHRQLGRRGAGGCGCGGARGCARGGGCADGGGCTGVGGCPLGGRRAV